MPARAQLEPQTTDPESLLGVWKLLSFEMANQETGQRLSTLGDAPRGRLTLSPSGQMRCMTSSWQGDRLVSVSFTLAGPNRFDRLIDEGVVLACQGEQTCWRPPCG